MDIINCSKTYFYKIYYPTTETTLITYSEIPQQQYYTDYIDTTLFQIFFFGMFLSLCIASCNKKNYNSKIIYVEEENQKNQPIVAAKIIDP